MPDRRSYKVDVAPEAHMAAKIHCTLRGINIKDYITNLILNDVDKRTIELIKGNSKEVSKLDSNLKRLTNISSNQKHPIIESLEKADLNAPAHVSINQCDECETNQINNNLHDNELESELSVKASPTAYQIYNFISNESEKAITLEEIINTLPNISKPAAQTALYWLLRENLVQRKLRENSTDKRKNSWAYWKLQSSVILEKRGIDVNNLLELIPQDSKHAISVRELVAKLDLPSSTIRDALRQLEVEGKITSTYGTNHKNQPTLRYCRVSPHQKTIIADRPKAQTAYMAMNVI